MSDIAITFVQLDGSEKVVSNATEGESMMEIAKANDVDGILGDCGGGCACATCHVYVDEQWREVVGAPDDIEDMTLDMIADIRKDNSRLCCQINVTEAMNGLRVTVVPDEF